MPNPVPTSSSASGVLVLIAGIADPRKPLPPRPDAAALTQHRAGHGVLSPFDEAALELALKLRDADPALAIHACVCTAAPADMLPRHVAGFRLASVRGLQLDLAQAVDSTRLATQLAETCRAIDPALLLIGREFGDTDDGSLPALLAEALQRPFASQTLAVQADGDAWRVRRQAGAQQEQWRLPRGALLAVTNEASNRLRHPLLKNVMAARTMRFETQMPVHHPAAPLAIVDVAPAREAPRAAACRMLDGPLEQQATQLAELLLAAREGAVR